LSAELEIFTCPPPPGSTPSGSVNLFATHCDIRTVPSGPHPAGRRPPLQPAPAARPALPLMKRPSTPVCRRWRQAGPPLIKSQASISSRAARRTRRSSHGRPLYDIRRAGSAPHCDTLTSRPSRRDSKWRPSTWFASVVTRPSVTEPSSPHAEMSATVFPPKGDWRQKTARRLDHLHRTTSTSHCSSIETALGTRACVLPGHLLRYGLGHLPKAAD